MDTRKMADFTDEDIAEAQRFLNLYPSTSEFWDSFMAEWFIEVIRVFDLVPTVSEQKIRDNYNAMKTRSRS